MKKKRGSEKAWNFFWLKPIILDVWNMSNGFMAILDSP